MYPCCISGLQSGRLVSNKAESFFNHSKSLFCLKKTNVLFEIESRFIDGPQQSQALKNLHFLDLCTTILTTCSKFLERELNSTFFAPFWGFDLNQCSPAFFHPAGKLIKLFQGFFKVGTPSELHLYDHLLWLIFSSSIILFRYGIYVLVGLLSGGGEPVWVQLL